MRVRRGVADDVLVDGELRRHPSRGSPTGCAARRCRSTAWVSEGWQAELPWRIS